MTHSTMTRLFTEDGGGTTVFGLSLLTGILLVGGLALDTSQSIAARTKLQVAADAAGHAAMYDRFTANEATARANAVEIARMHFPTNRFGEVLADADIEFGDWDATNRVFTPDNTSNNAVRVTTRRLEGNGNALDTLLLHMVGIGEFNLNTASVWVAAPPGCAKQGFVANGIVDLQSNNAYYNGFCIHSNTHVELNQNNFFELGVVVSMPDEDDLVVPASGMNETKNPGLAAALREDDIDLDTVFSGIAGTVASFSNPASEVQPDYITVATRQTPTVGNKLKNSDLVRYAVNEIGCSGNQSLTVDKNEVIRDVVIYTNCAVKFSQGAAMENAVLVTTNTGAQSVNAPSGLRLGADDGCTPGGGAQIVTMGGVKAASKLEVYGSQVIANGDVQAAAQSNGFDGVSFIVNGRIDATSNGQAGTCPEDGVDTILLPVEMSMVN